MDGDVRMVPLRFISTQTERKASGKMKFTEAFVFTLRWNMSTAEVISFDFMVPVRSLTVHLNEH